ncbi:GntR family transcriptional regulator [uncultured Tessaracoccus sp.]|uniref:GntR family transcriptional regulator n=1 Tax=uncultured Tessaracoccus sp. TaxID=905023 RepID=UPI002605B419|nr:GntR family transcriptional regulator [uncultured Tessaracoccus sp.]
MSKEHFSLEVEIDRSSPTPLHQQIADPLISLIQSGAIEPGTKLEDEVSMAHRLEVSRPTARRALETLVNRGLIVRRRGAGTAVAPRQIHRPMALTSLHDDLARDGHRVTTEVLEWLAQPADEDTAAMLSLAVGTPVVRIKRLRFTDGEPLALMTNVLPETTAPTRAELVEHGFYELLRERGVQIKLGTQNIGARLADDTEARLLDEPPGAALLTMQRTAYDEQQQPVEVGTHVYRASRYTYSQTVFA